MRKNESFVFAHIPRNILCLSLLPLVYPVSVRPSIFVFPFSSSPGLCVAGLSLAWASCPPLHDQVRQSTYLSVSFLARAAFYMFQAVFTFEIKRGTNSGRRALMVTVQSVIAASNVAEKTRKLLSRATFRFFAPCLHSSRDIRRYVVTSKEF